MSRYSPARYLFEGQQRTVAEIHERYPAYSGTFLRRALGDGATTLAELAIARERGIRRRADAGKFVSASSPWRRGIGARRG